KRIPFETKGIIDDTAIKPNAKGSEFGDSEICGIENTNTASIRTKANKLKRLKLYFKSCKKIFLSSISCRSTGVIGCIFIFYFVNLYNLLFIHYIISILKYRFY